MTKVPTPLWLERSAPNPMPLLRRVTAGSVADLLIDTDIFIDHLRGARQLRPGRHRLHYSVITRAELIAGNTATNLTIELLGPMRELIIDRAVAERAGRIAREFGLRLPDALIAATAVEHQLGLVTRNSKDFALVRGLRIRNIA